MEWLCHFYSGGTTLDVPIRELPQSYWGELGCPPGKTDVIIITDALVHAPEKDLEFWNTWRQQEQVKSYGIIIGNEPGDLSKVCDRCWTVDAIGVEQDCVSELLSL